MGNGCPGGSHFVCIWKNTDFGLIEIVRKALEGWREDESEAGVLQAGDTVLYQTVFVKVVQ